MIEAKNGDTVKVHYTATLEDGHFLDTTRKRQPLELLITDDGVLSGFARGIAGMKIGETKTIKLPPEKACGPRRNELIMKVNKADLQKEYPLAAGQRIRVKRPGGKAAKAIIIESKEDTVTVDANPPLAGETLVFDVELLEIVHP